MDNQHATPIVDEPPGKIIDRLVEERGLRKEWLARQCGMHRSQLSKVISGERPLAPAYAEKMAEIFNVPVSMLCP